MAGARAAAALPPLFDADKADFPGGNENEIVLLNKSAMTHDDRAGRLMKGHLWAAVAASWMFSVSKAAGVIFGGAISGEPFAAQLFQITLLTCSFFAVTLLVVLFAAFIPVLLAWWLARQYSISSVWYFVAAGALSAVIL